MKRRCCFATALALSLLLAHGDITRSNGLQDPTRYSELERAGCVNGIDVSALVARDGVVTNETACAEQEPRLRGPHCATVFLGSGDSFQVRVSVAPRLLTLQGRWPTALHLRLCYSNASAVGRDWRKFDDTVTRDKRCHVEVASAPFEFNTSRTFEWEPADDTGVGTVTFCAVVMCSDVTCHVACFGPPPGPTDNPVRLASAYFLVRADSVVKPWLTAVAAVLAAIGPLLFTAVASYEMGVKRKRVLADGAAPMFTRRDRQHKAGSGEHKAGSGGLPGAGSVSVRRGISGARYRPVK